MNVKTGAINNKFLLTGYKFMSEMHLQKPIMGKYSAVKLFGKQEKKFRNLRKQVTLSRWFSYKNKLDKACFHYDLAYAHRGVITGDAADTKLCDKAFNIANLLLPYKDFTI